MRCGVLLLLALAPAAALSATPEREEPELSAVDERIAKEGEAFRNRFALMPHQPSYILPLTYSNKVNQQSFEDIDGEVERLEMKFQLSIKLPLKRNLFGDNGHLSFGYTQVSFWQAYNSQVSSPFRETNHEPELMLSFFNDYRLFGVRNRIITLGLVHQSNGQPGTRSRSWNRVYANFLFERNRWAFGLRPWYRIPESIEDDDNPDIDRYLGNGELIAAYRLGEHVLDLMVRNNLDAPNKGAIRLGWSFPINERVNGFVQYFNGYGESLIDYNTSINRIGFGILLTNWL